MNAAFDTYPSLEMAFSDRFRGHNERDWTEWAERHFYDSATAIPPQAGEVWLNRQKLNYRGISDKNAIRHLIAANVDQAFLGEIGSLVDLKRLELECPFLAADLTPLLSLTNLEHLSIDSPRNLSDLSPLLELPRLKTLLITNAKKMPNIEWLRGAHHLEVIGIEGAIDCDYTIQSLAPLAGLRSLRAFLGVSTRLADKSLMPLAECPKLEFLAIARFAPRSAFEQLQQARPDIFCRWFDPKAWGTAALKPIE
ncbi:hypothetical protein V6R86_03775 [Sphingomonas kaistensis]|uniref:Leucine-rich repeat domain-containing protein n=1 Tax=Sphingomonas kaistensis TaxID=298708 RepID=A0ABZ2FYD3_9SPHN